MQQLFPFSQRAPASYRACAIHPWRCYASGNSARAGPDAKQGIATHDSAAIVSSGFEKRSIMTGNLLRKPQAQMVIAVMQSQDIPGL
jgi:hypothetical protein